ncbi:hypothetical protein CY35_01G014400 [Sphagnum magellanicum]|nr:hypothetical protein CY35_01G014400 [Sphagnum magellanicum]
MAALVCPSSCVVCSSSSSCCLIIPTKLQSSRKHVRARVGIMRASSSEAAECNCRQQCTKEATRPLILRRDMLSLAGVMAIAGLQMTPSLDPTAANAAAATAASFCADFSVSPSGLAFCDSSPGSGIQASKGMLIKAHYTGKLESGQVFDSSYNRGKPLTFRIGVGEVISGWDQGILGTDGIPPMLAGGKRTLRIPPQLAYGERGAGCRLGSCLIPPNSTLLFDVEFVGKA